MMLTDTQQECVGQAAKLFDAGEYFAAHELLEEAWREASEPARTFLKGLIHAAVSLYQYQRGNAHGARVKAASCRRYLAPYRPRWGRVDVEALIAELECFVAPLESVRRGEPLPEPGGPWPSLRPAP